MKRFFVTLLASAMMLVLLGTSGCQPKVDDNGSEQVELIWSNGWSEQKDTAKVMEKFNEMLKDVLPNTTVKILNNVDASRFSLMMAAKEAVDISWTGYSTDPAAEIANGYYMGLNDLVKNYGTKAIKNEMTKFKPQYESGTVDGELYLIPHEQPILHQSAYFQVPVKFLQYFDSDAFLAECHSNYFTTEKVYQILDKYFQKLKSNNLLDQTTSFYVQDVFLALATRGYDWVETYRSGAWLCYEAHAENPQIINFQSTEQYKLFIKYAAKWYTEGIIPQDILVSGSSAGADTVVFAEGNVTEMWFGLDEERGVRYLRKADTDEVYAHNFLTDTYENMFNGTSIIGSEKTYSAIPFTSKHPERAMMLLDVLRSEEGRPLLNLLVYGIEGEHYTLKGDVAYGNGYKEQATSSNLYGVPHWKVGNVFLTYRTPNILDGQIEYAYDYLANVKPKQFNTKLFGFKTNLSDQYAYEVNQIAQVISEYQDTLVHGTKGNSYQSTYNELMQKLKVAKIDSILETVNAMARKHMGK